MFGALPVLRSAPKLKHLALEHCPYLLLTLNDVLRLADEAPNLETLTVHGPAAAAAALVRKLPNLFIC